MKKILVILLIILGYQVFSQKRVEATIHVDGVCDMCKKRIERALDVPGITFAEWDKKTHKLYVVYRPKKISEERIHQLLNEAGHDTEKSKAPDDRYETVAECCRYRDENNPHKKGH
ncbi:MAG: heavy-metal-associated domain-containing protein [Thermaurantimonas sp.]|uniref:heavy-metal-associated domain-containing protein n=1 Tax=Thermaurantimonas sp. TaxID=2681568 RepID=UPI00391B7AE1